MIKEFKPMIKNWEFLFPAGKLREAKNILVAFSKVCTGTEKHFDAPSEFFIGGSIDDKKVRTLPVKSINVVEGWKPEPNEWFSGKYTLDELEPIIEHDIFCVTTQDGHKYYLDSTELSGNMFLYLGAISNCA